MKELLKKALDYFRYPSTYQALVAGLTYVGVNLTPEFTEVLTGAGVGLFTLIGFLFSDADVKKKK